MAWYYRTRCKRPIACTDAIGLRRGLKSNWRYRQPPRACRNHDANVKNDEYRFGNDTMHGPPSRALEFNNP
jgi:hypothetical protein